MITLIITTNLKYSDAVGEAQMLEAPHDDAFPGVEPSKSELNIDLEDEFDVKSPNQLRGTLADETLDADEEDRRREIAREWDHLQRRVEIVGFAIREWDFLAPTTDPSEVLSK